MLYIVRLGSPGSRATSFSHYVWCGDTPVQPLAERLRVRYESRVRQGAWTWCTCTHGSVSTDSILCDNTPKVDLRRVIWYHNLRQSEVPFTAPPYLQSRGLNPDWKIQEWHAYRRMSCNCELQMKNNWFGYQCLVSSSYEIWNVLLKYLIRASIALV